MAIPYHVVLCLRDLKPHRDRPMCVHEAPLISRSLQCVSAVDKGVAGTGSSRAAAAGLLHESLPELCLSHLCFQRGLLARIGRWLQSGLLRAHSLLHSLGPCDS